MYLVKSDKGIIICKEVNTDKTSVKKIINVLQNNMTDLSDFPFPFEKCVPKCPRCRRDNHGHYTSKYYDTINTVEVKKINKNQLKTIKLLYE